MKNIRYLLPESWKRALSKSRLMRWYTRRQLISPVFPQNVAIMTGIYPCSHKCRMCPQFQKRPAQNITISLSQFRKIIDGLPDSGYRLELSSYGETLLAEGLTEMIRYAKTKRPNVPLTLATNGLMLNDDISVELIESGLDIIQVSLNAPDAESFKWLMGINGFDNTSENIKNLVRLRDRKKSKTPHIYTHIIDLNEFDRPTVSKAINNWNSIVDRADARPLGNWGGLINGQGCTRKWNMPQKRYPCAWLWSATKILPDGEVNKCFVHFLSGEPGLGNINEQNLKDIWQGEKLARVRQKHLEGRYHEEPLCGDCDIWALFPNVF